MTDQLLEIRQQLQTLPGGSIFAQAIRNGVQVDLNGTIGMIKSQAADNYTLVADIVGEDLLTSIMEL